MGIAKYPEAIDEDGAGVGKGWNRFRLLVSE